MSTRNKTRANTPVDEKPESKRFSDPLESLLVWAELVADEPIGGLLSSLHVDIAQYKEFKRANPGLVNELKQINAAARLLDREKTAKLLLVRYNELLMTAKTAREVRDLALAASRMPDWVFGEEPYSRSSVPVSRAGVQAHTAAHNARTHAAREAAAQEPRTREVPVGAMCSGGE